MSGMGFPVFTGIPVFMHILFSKNLIWYYFLYFPLFICIIFHSSHMHWFSYSISCKSIFLVILLFWKLKFHRRSCNPCSWLVTKLCQLFMLLCGPISCSVAVFHPSYWPNHLSCWGSMDDMLAAVQLLN